MRIIGIAGTNGAGKDTVGQILAEDYKWMFVSGSDILRKELERRGLEIERSNLRALSGEWRRTHGLGVLIDMTVDIYNRSTGQYQGLAISSIRNPGEAARVHELGGKIIWVDADPKIRYQRIYSRGRSAEDNKTFEQFLSEERAEMSHSGDETTLNMAGVKAKADIFIENNGNKLDEFKRVIARKLSLQ